MPCFIDFWSEVSHFFVRTHTHARRVNLRWARLVQGWVTVSRFDSRCGTFISICNQPSRLTQPGHPFVGRRNEYQTKGGDALRLQGSKGKYGSCVGGRQNCVIRWSYCCTRAVSERFRDKRLGYINSSFLYILPYLHRYRLTDIRVDAGEHYRGVGS